MVHADLSEYNLLWDERGHGRVWVIDVGQAVETSHPKTDEFLEKDAHNVTAFFEKKGVRCLPEPELIALVTDDGVGSVFRSRQQASVFRHRETLSSAWTEGGAEAEEGGGGGGLLGGPEEDDDDTGAEEGSGNEGIAAAIGGSADPVTARLKAALASHIALAREQEQARQEEEAAEFAAELEREEEESAREQAQDEEEEEVEDQKADATGGDGSHSRSYRAPRSVLLPGTRTAAPAEPTRPLSGAGIGGPVAPNSEAARGSASGSQTEAVPLPLPRPAGAWGARASGGGLASVLVSRHTD